MMALKSDHRCLNLIGRSGIRPISYVVGKTEAMALGARYYSSYHQIRHSLS